MFLKLHHVILAAIVTIAAVLPASAQGFNPAQVKRLNDVRAGLPDIGRPYTVRVTTGASSNAGFEKSLTDTDPNLKHWTWVPVTNFNQAYIRVAPGQQDIKQPSYQRPKSVYHKPITVPLPTVRRQDWGYPRQIASRSSGRSSSDVSATVSYNKPTRVETQTRMYSNSDASGRLYAPRTAYDASRDVYGRLITH